MNRNLTFEENIDGTNFTFFVSIELKEVHATVNIEAVDSNKQQFEKLSNNSNILKDLALRVLINETKENYRFVVNQLQSGVQWLGQFTKVK